MPPPKKVYRVFLKRNQRSKWELDREFDTLNEAQARRRNLAGYAYETEVRIGKEKQSNPSILKRLKKGIKGTIQIKRGRLVIKT